MIPSEKDIELPLLESLIELGGQAPAFKIYPLVKNKFPKLTENDVKQVTKTGRNKWNNRIQWTRKKLIEKGEMYSVFRGVWGITNKGRERLDKYHKEKIWHIEPEVIDEILNQYFDILYYTDDEEKLDSIIKKMIEFSFNNLEKIVDKAIERIENDYYNGSKWSTLAFSISKSLNWDKKPGLILKKLAEKEDTNPAYLNNYGVFLLQNKNEECLEYFAKAFAIDHKHRGLNASLELPAWKNLTFLKEYLKLHFRERRFE